MYILLEVFGDYKRRHQLGRLNTLGRALDNTIVLQDCLVSRHHAEIKQLDDDRFQIADLGSTYGTHVCRKRIEECFLTEGDELIIGTKRLYFEESLDQKTPFRRWEERIECDFRVQVVVSIDKTAEARCTNLSLGGMSIELEANLEADEIVDLYFAVSETSGPLKTRARVAHGGSAVDGWGLAFLFHSEDAREQVAKLFRKLMLDT